MADSKRDEERRERVSRIVFGGQVVSKGHRPNDEED